MELTQVQIKSIISEELSKPGGLDRLVKITLELLMQSERDIHNLEHSDVCNGCRSRRFFAMGQVLELQVPRTRRASFRPYILAVLKSQREEMSNVSWLLYTQGNVSST